MNIIDQLGDVREEIRVLKAREEQLRQQVLGQGRNDVTGARFRVRIDEKPQRRFIKEKLPTAILNDPSFWRQEMRTYVRTTQLSGAPEVRTPSFARRKAPLPTEVEDFDVIED